MSEECFLIAARDCSLVCQDWLTAGIVLGYCCWRTWSGTGSGLTESKDCFLKVVFDWRIVVVPDPVPQVAWVLHLEPVHLVKVQSSALSGWRQSILEDPGRGTGWEQTAGPQVGWPGTGCMHRSAGQSLAGRTARGTCLAAPWSACSGAPQCSLLDPGLLLFAVHFAVGWNWLVEKTVQNPGLCLKLVHCLIVLVWQQILANVEGQELCFLKQS